MIKCAGIGVAVGNAIQTLKDESNFIAVTLRKYFIKSFSVLLGNYYRNFLAKQIFFEYVVRHFSFSQKLQRQ